MKGELFDDPPESPKRPSKGRLTKVEQRAGNETLAEAIGSGDSDLLARVMAVALYRLGAEPLNDLAKEMMKRLEQEGMA